MTAEKKPDKPEAEPEVVQASATMKLRPEVAAALGIQGLQPAEDYATHAVGPVDPLARFADPAGIELKKSIAEQLISVVEEQKLAKVLDRRSGKKFLFVEAWTFLGSSVGVMPRTVSCVEVRDPTDPTRGVLGFEATVEVIRLATGQIISRAMARCMLDETLTKKNGAAIIRWEDHHAAFSMAQTRATSKALAQPLRWLAVLAGYSGTPADEVTDAMERDAQARPGKSAAGDAASAAKSAANAISQKQVGRLWAVAYARVETLGRDKKDADPLVRFVIGQFGHESTKEIQRDNYDEIIARIEGFEDKPAEGEKGSATPGPDGEIKW